MKTFAKGRVLAVLAGATIVTLTGCASDRQEDHGISDIGGARLYPRAVCLVTDREFKHGQPYSFVHDGQEIQLCCKECLALFKKNPARFLARLGDGK